MLHQPRRVLSEPTRLVLFGLGEALRTGHPLSDHLDMTLTDLAALRPEVVARADREIADAAGLQHGSSTHRTLLSQTPRLAWMFIFHRDGRLREAALRQIGGGLESPFLVAAVALRLNDWAAPVRAAARACAERTFPQTQASVLARAMPFLMSRRDHWRRWNEEPAILAASLARPDVAAALADLFRTGEFGGLARAFRQALRQPGIDRYLLDLASRARQPAVRAMALEALIDGQASWIEGFERQWIDKVYGKSRLRPVFERRPVGRPVPL